MKGTIRIAIRLTAWLAGLTALGALSFASAAVAQCTGVASVPPAQTPPGVRMVQYSSSPIIAGGAIVAQRNCYLLVNTSGTTRQTSADLFLSEEGGFPGPWFVDPGTVGTVDLADGAPASCSIPTPGTVRFGPSSGFLPAGSASDACCFEWYSTNNDCSGLPLAGSVAEVHTSVGLDTFLELVIAEPPAIPSGGVTCGLIGVEVLLVWPLLRRRRRSRDAS